ncbi:ovochymase-2-like isoform X2 [Cimex lectularius]|uniref:Peptidase S1 domain-containing protein n=1 Tax=Cimex lectularius TaxID=79782 RepID=A0A8I6RV39_CIMLE|nr:ovochymase-2-like isoform X2 [Cimex lectularius]
MNFIFVTSVLFIIVVSVTSIMQNRTDKFVSLRKPKMKFNFGDPTEHSWLIVLMRNISFLCSGALISSTHAISAAHCCATDKNRKTKAVVANLKVWVGVHNRLNFHSKYTVGYNVESCSFHYINQGFSINHLYGLALIKTKKRIEFNFIVAPICLPTKNCQTDISSCIDLKKYDVNSYGWGADRNIRLETPGLFPKSEPVWYLDKDKCKHKHFTKHSLIYYECVVGLNSKKTCLGLSGTPVIAVDKATKKTVLLGIIAAGPVCFHHVNIYKAYVISVGALDHHLLPEETNDIKAKHDTQSEICTRSISKNITKQ